MVPTFFDVTRNQAEVAAPLLERHSLTGWFFVIPEFMDVPPSEQISYAEAHDIDVIPHEYGTGRLTLSWDEVRALSVRHVVASHMLSHTALTHGWPDALMAREIRGSKRALEAQVGREVKRFAWLWGSEYGLSAGADAYPHALGYAYLFSTFKVQNLTVRPK